MAKKTSPAQRPQGRNKAEIIIVAVLAIVVVALGVYAYSRHHHPSTALTTPTPSASASASASPSPSASAAPSAAPTPTPASGPVGQCATADLAGSLDTTGGGTAGTIYRQLILTNHGSQSCTVYGFPGVSLVNAAGAQLGSPADRNGAAGSTITLAPGQSAASPVGFPDAGNFAPGTCSAPSTSLKVYPPNQTTALTIALSAQWCPGFSVQTLVAH